MGFIAAEIYICDLRIVETSFCSFKAYYKITSSNESIFKFFNLVFLSVYDIVDSEEESAFSRDTVRLSIF